MMIPHLLDAKKSVLLVVQSTVMFLHLKEFKKLAQEEGYIESIKTQIEALEQELQADKENDLIKNRKELEDLLRLEIVGRYYYQVGRIIASLENDPDLEEAFKILLDKDRYESILKP